MILIEDENLPLSLHLILELVLRWYTRLSFFVDNRSRDQSPWHVENIINRPNAATCAHNISVMLTELQFDKSSKSEQIVIILQQMCPMVVSKDAIFVANQSRDQSPVHAENIINQLRTIPVFLI